MFSTLCGVPHSAQNESLHSLHGGEPQTDAPELRRSDHRRGAREGSERYVHLLLGSRDKTSKAMEELLYRAYVEVVPPTSDDGQEGLTRQGLAKVKFRPPDQGLRV
jgi:hypothetical protein